MDKKELKAAAVINFRSRKDTKRKMERNPNYKTDSAKSSRKDTKLNNRRRALQSLNVDAMTRATITKILVPELMSSEDEEEDGEEKMFITRKLTWRSEGVDSCLSKLDEIHKQSQSKHARYRAFKRNPGPPSLRPEPVWSPEMEKVFSYFDE
ncbi:uncharacterized protein [Clytia hemisphaerica]